MAETEAGDRREGGKMKVTISNEIYIREPSAGLLRWARENLVILNPEYSKKQRMGLWTGKTEKQLYFFYVDGCSFPAAVLAILPILCVTTA